MNSMLKKGWITYSLISVVLASLVGGCVTTTQEPVSQEPVDFGQNPPLVLVITPEKRVEFFEWLFRVLTWSAVDNFYSFQGTWDPATELSERVVTAIRSEYGVKASPLQSVLPSGEYAGIVKACEQSFGQGRSDPKGGAGLSGFGRRFGAASPYMASVPPEQLLAIRDQVDTDYLIEVILCGIAVTRASSMQNYVDVFTRGRVIRLSDGKILRTSKAIGRAPVGKIKSFAELETDNLRPLRALYSDCVSGLLGQKQINTMKNPNLQPKQRLLDGLMD